MLTRPDDLPDIALIDALADGWSLGIATLEYRAIGFGSHHWCTTDTSGGRWFVTVDDLDVKRRSADEQRDAAFERLRRALATSRALSDSGTAFVVAPLPSRHGSVVLRVSERFALALYPYVDGHSEVGPYESTGDRLAVLELILAVHSSPTGVTREALPDDFVVPNRDELMRALADLAGRWGGGPYSERARELLSEHAASVRRLLHHHDRLAGEARRRPDRFVLTHGEPHRQNTIFSATGLLLVDWDTALLAPPERDLWMLESGAGPLADAYAKATGTRVLQSMLDLYGIAWDLAEVAIYTARFRAPHTDDADSRESWSGLVHFLHRTLGWSSLG